MYSAWLIPAFDVYSTAAVSIQPITFVPVFIVLPLFASALCQIL